MGNRKVQIFFATCFLFLIHFLIAIVFKQCERF